MPLTTFSHFSLALQGQIQVDTYGSRFRISRFFASWPWELLHCCTSVDFDFDFSYVNIMKEMHAQIIHGKSKIVTRF